MGHPPSAHCQTKRPTSGPSTPLNPGCLGGRINPLQSPFLFLPPTRALHQKLVSDVKPTRFSQSSHTRTKTSLSQPGTRPHASPSRSLFYPQASTSLFRFGPVAPDHFQVCPGAVFSSQFVCHKISRPAAHSPSIRQDGQPNLVRSLHHCSLIKSPGPDRDYTLSKDPSAISTHPSPTDSIPRVALPRLTSPHPVTGALSCQSLRSLAYPHAPATLITQNTTTLLPAHLYSHPPGVIC